MKHITLVIPAYQPNKDLLAYVRLLAKQPCTSIIVIDDGSGKKYDALFQDIARIKKVHLLKHAVNCGKGAALKSAFHYWLCSYPKDKAVLCLDADGQHSLRDVMRISKQQTKAPSSLILGCRTLATHSKVPLRSKVGNLLTKYFFYLLVGQKLQDTQTGLRIIPRSFVYKLLYIKENRYEFELEMLIQTKQNSIKIQELPIQSIYEKNNPTSHFNPFWDSMRIYYVLFRSFIASGSNAVLDNLIFIMGIQFALSLASSQILARVTSTIYSFFIIRNVVFRSQNNVGSSFIKYIFLTVSSGFISYGSILMLSDVFGLSVISSKLIAESVIYFANFTIQRDFIFYRRAKD